MQVDVPAPQPFITFSNIVSLVALATACLSLYLQRRDKRPRLVLQYERIPAEVPAAETTDYGTVPMIMMDVIKISAANPTDKQINIVSTEFQPKGSQPFIPPIQDRLTAIPSHEVRHTLIPWDEFTRRLEDKGLAQKGNFIFTDALGRKHKMRWP